MYGGFFFSSRRRHTRFDCDWSSDVCSSDLELLGALRRRERPEARARATREDGGPGGHGDSLSGRGGGEASRSSMAIRATSLGGLDGFVSKTGPSAPASSTTRASPPAGTTTT